MARVPPVDAVILCPPGFEEVVAEAAVRELPGCAESDRSSGFVRVRTLASVRELRGFRCATNVFAMIDEVPRTTIDTEAHRLAERLPTVARPYGLPNRGSLRLRVHDDGHFAPTASRSVAGLEKALETWSGLRVSRGGASLEAWLIRRSGLRHSLLTTRLSGGRPRLERGQLRPEIGAALARVEPLEGAKLVLDPFAGSGSIGIACLEAGAGAVWLNDIEGRASGRDRIRWTHVDFRKLRVEPGTVDAVVTDPPWGRYRAVRGGIDHLYGDIGAAARAWLRPGGALVLLTGAPASAVGALADAGRLRIELDFPVLVNGSKARVIRARQGRRRRAA